MLSLDNRVLLVPEAKRWQPEPFVPIEPGELVAALLRRDAQGDDADRATSLTFREAPTDADTKSVEAVYQSFRELLHIRYRPYFTEFAERYARIDPDRDTCGVIKPAALSKSEGEVEEDSQQAIQQIGLVAREVLHDAAYSPILRQELEDSANVYSHWGIPLRINFDLFDAIVVYVRGDVIGRRAKRRWQTFYREMVYEVPLYQRVVVMFKLKPDTKTDYDLDNDMLHLLLFKNIPRDDVDMLLPGTQVRFSWLDHLTNFMPSLGGIGLTLFKLIKMVLFLAVFTLNIFVAIALLFYALINYALRSLFNHWNARNRYMLNLTRNLYQQKLDSNVGVACRLLEEAEGQRFREAALAYHVLRNATGPMTPETLSERAERIVRELIGVDIEFRAGDAIRLLDEWGLILRDPPGYLQTYATHEVLTRLAAQAEAAVHP
jgi:hypothetical protein